MIKTIVLIAMLFAVSFARLDAGEYRISCKVDPNNVLDIEKAVNDDGANLIVYPWHTGNNQRFILAYIDGNQAMLVAKHSEKALTASGKGIGYVQLEAEAIPEQLFYITETKDNYYMIKSVTTGHVMNCNSNEKSDINNRLAIQQTRDCSDAQKLIFQRLDVA